MSTRSSRQEGTFSASTIGECVTESADFSKQGVDLHVGEDCLDAGARLMQIATETRLWNEPSTLSDDMEAWSSLWVNGVWVVRGRGVPGTHCWYTAWLEFFVTQFSDCRVSPQHVQVRVSGRCNFGREKGRLQGTTQKLWVNASQNSSRTMIEATNATPIIAIIIIIGQI